MAGGTALATAAAVTAIAVGQTDRAVDTEPAPAETPTRAPEPTPSESPSPTAGETRDGTPAPAPAPTLSEDTEDTPSATSTDEPSEPGAPVQTLAIPVYFPGPGPDGLRLFREWHVTETSDKLSSAALLAVTRAPKDPDYEQPWPAGTDATAEWDGDVITVDLETDGVDRDLHAGWPGLDDETAATMVQQLVFTVQAALGEGRVPVRLLLDGSFTDQVVGVPTSEEITNDPVLDTLNLVSLDEPEEGAVVDDGSLEVTGVANSFEANVLYRLQRFEGTEVVAQSNITASGWTADRLFPFAGTIDVSEVEPGRYVLTVMTDDPSNGEGIGTFTDTRAIRIE